MVHRLGRVPTDAWDLAALLALASVVPIDCGGGGGSSSPTAPPQPSSIDGSGNVVQETRQVSGFDELNLVGIGTVHFEQSNSESLVVEAEDNLLQYLRTEVVGNVLVISTAPGVDLRPTEPIEYRVTAPQLQEARLDGVGEIECPGLTADRLRLEADGVGEMQFDNLDLRRLVVQALGVAQVRVNGQVTAQDVTISGVSDYGAENLNSSRAVVENRGSGDATVRVSDRLTATVSGSGCVFYIGDPILEETITGSGCIEQIED